METSHLFSNSVFNVDMETSHLFSNSTTFNSNNNMSFT